MEGTYYSRFTAGNKTIWRIEKTIGSVSQNVLTSQLRQMKKSGLLTRKVYPEVPPRVEYTLTELGQSLKPVLDAMWNWGEEYKVKNATSHIGDSSP